MAKKKYLGISIVLVLQAFTSHIFAQDKPVDISAKYNVYAALSDTADIIKGLEKITVYNHTTDTLSSIWLHAAPNAFSNDHTPYTKFSINSGDTRFYFSEAKDKGFLDGFSFEAEQKPVKALYDEESGEFVKIILEKKLQPGDSTILTTPFTLKLPAKFDALGKKEDSIFLADWFLKLGQYDKLDGWRLQPFVGTKYNAQQKADYEITFHVNNTDKKFVLNHIADAAFIWNHDTISVAGKDDFGHTLYWIKKGVDNNESLTVQQLQQKKLISNKMPAEIEKFLLQNYEAVNKGQPIVYDKERTAYEYYLFENIKAKLWFEKVKKNIGDEAYKQFTHDIKNALKVLSTQHLLQILQKSTVYNIDTLAGLLHTPTSLYNVQHKKLRPAFLFNLKETDKYHYLNLAPVAGYNNYDRLMLGLLIHNYQLPQPTFNFYVAPVYAWHTQKVNGIAGASYNIFKQKFWLQFAIKAAGFTYNQVDLDALPSVYYTIRKMTPSVKINIYDQDNTPERRWELGIKNYYLHFEKYTFQKDNLLDMYTTTPAKAIANITEVYVQRSNARVLYPYDLRMEAQAHKDFLRIGLDACYFFNYSAQERGISTRLFGGKFIYLQPQTLQKQFETSPYHLQLSPTATSDYTYSEYFVGRNEQEGWMAKQITMRDGFFKVNMPMKYQAAGVSDDWITALNFVADVPFVADPFKKLPFNNFLKLFLDVGSYAGAWQENATTGKFVYDAGLQISIFKEAVNIYIPLVYSKAYRDHYRSVYGKHYFAKTISFSLDPVKLKPRAIKNILPL